MRSVEDKGCLNNGNGGSTAQEVSSMATFEFHKSCNSGGSLTRTPSHHHHHRTALGKPMPSKWDDAQKWLVNLPRGEKNPAKASPRNSNADDRRLIAPVPKKDYASSSDEGEENGRPSSDGALDQFDMETKNVVNCDNGEESVWRINKHLNSNRSPAVRSICVRDTGTDMTPIASQEPSRTATPIRATTPAARSPISSGTSTPVRCADGAVGDTRNGKTREGDRANAVNKTAEDDGDDESGKISVLESRASAWDEAERAKYTARYRREEVKIQAWENHQKRKAEMEMRKMEVKAERMKSRAQEKYTNKVVAARRIAEEKRANAEAKLNESGVKTSERADYIRRTGRLPSSFSFFKLPSSSCWQL